MNRVKKIFVIVLTFMLSLSVLIPTANAADFIDISGHWAENYIKTCANLGIIDGVGGAKFDPEGTVTNAQFVKMLCVAFYSMEGRTFEDENRAAIDIYFGGSIQWYSGKSYYFEKMGFLDKVDYNIRSNTSADQPMNRTNMAQVTANVLVQKNISASGADMDMAQATMPDYYSIPETNRSAVKMCYALEILTGTDGGKFDGSATMTRAQACTVITRLLDVVKTGPVTTTPFDPIETPEPTVKDIVVTPVPNSTLTNITGGPYRGTAYHITDNGNPTGYLGNGKPINEENIAELLTKAKETFPNDMTWSNATTNNNWYGNPGSIATEMLSRAATGATYNESANAACGGFAALISDYLFGRTSNPYHIVTNFDNIRPGDVIVQLNTSKKVQHVLIATGINQTGSRAGYVFVAEGNLGNVIHWPGTSGWDAAGPEDLATYGSYVAISRWP